MGSIPPPGVRSLLLSVRRSPPGSAAVGGVDRARYGSPLSVPAGRYGGQPRPPLPGGDPRSPPRGGPRRFASPARRSASAPSLACLDRERSPPEHVGGLRGALLFPLAA